MQNNNNNKDYKKKYELLKNLISVLPENIYWKDRSGKFIGCNNNLAKIHKFKSPDDIIDLDDYDMLRKEDADIIVQTDKSIMDSGKGKILEEYGFNKDGKPATYLTHKVPIKNENNKVIGMAGTSVDITKRIEDKKKIIELEKEKAILANSIAHEVGNLLAGIKIYSQLLRNSVEKEKISKNEINKKIIQLDDCITNANSVFTSLKMNMRQGQEEITTTQFELTKISEDIANVLNTYFNKNETLRLINVDYKTDFYYYGIPSYTRNVLINLIKNSLYFIKEKGTGNITIEAKNGIYFNELSIIDTGCGIPKDIMKDLFKPFFTSKLGGAGMGLSFCKMVMEGYGGKIACESEVSKYTKFTISFPKKSLPKDRI